MSKTSFEALSCSALLCNAFSCKALSCKALLIVAILVSVSGCASLAVQQTPGQPVASNAPQDFSYRVQPGDRLVDIARALTGDASNWESIAEINGITEPKKLASGSVLRIPGEFRDEPSGTRNASLNPSSRAVASNGGAPSVATGTGVSVARNSTPSASTSSDVDLHTVQVNRSFNKTPLNTPMMSEFKKLNARVQASEVRIVGTYYPVGIYAEPAYNAQLIKRVAPGSVFKVQGKFDVWYEITTAEGTGYIRQSDGALVE